MKSFKWQNDKYAHRRLMEVMKEYSNAFNFVIISSDHLDERIKSLKAYNLKSKQLLTKREHCAEKDLYRVTIPKTRPYYFYIYY